MMIVYSNDFLFHGQLEAPAVLHLELYSLLKIVIREAIGLEPILITECRNASGESFSRKRFFELSGITDPAPSYYLYDMARIGPPSWEYFTSFFGPDTFFVASEFGMDLREKLTELGIRYVNFWFHPYKLLNDAFFMVGTNAPDLFRKLEAHRVSQGRLRFYAGYYSELIRRRHFLDKLQIADNCCIFAGQTYEDKSISTGTRYLNITDYADKVSELVRTYTRVYYVPHPSAGSNEAVDAFLAATPGVEVLKNVPTYYLLASPKVKKVVALSSSILYEAEFFGKETEYLFRPLFKIDEDFSLNTFVSIYQDYFSTDFWQDLLDIRPKEKDVRPDRDGLPLLARDAEMFRDLLGLSFGYRHLGRLDRIEERFSNIDASIQALDARTEAFDSYLQSLEGKMQAYDASIQALDSRTLALDEAQHSHSALDAAVKALDARTLSFDAAIHELDARTLAFDAAINSLMERARTSSSAIKTMKTLADKIGEAERGVLHQGEDIESLKTSVVQIQKECRDLADSLARLSSSPIMRLLGGSRKP